MPLTLLGPLQKGNLGSREFSLYDFSGGINVKSAPQELADNQLIAGLNGYLRADGGFQMRNGMTQLTSAVTATGPVFGLAEFYQTIKNGVPVSPIVPVILEQVGNKLYQRGSATAIGTIGSGPMTTVHVQDPNDPNFSFSGTSSATGTTTLTDSSATWATNIFAGSIVQSGSSSAVVVSNTATVITVAAWIGGTPTDDQAFTITGGITDVTVICTGDGGPYVYDGTTLYVPAGWAAATNAQWCVVVNGIIYFGGINSVPNQIFGTGDGTPEDASMETLPAYRNFVMNTPVNGLCAQGTGSTANLVVGLQNGLKIISGSGPANYDEQDVPMEDGVAAGRTMIYWSGVVYWLGRTAVWAFNGQAPPIQISTNIEPWLLNDPYIPGYPFTTNRQLSFSYIYNNRLHISYCSNASVPNTVAVFDLIVQGWTVLQTNPGIYSAVLLDAPGDATPPVLVVGSSVNNKIYTWDVEPGAGNVATDAGVQILCQAQTKYFKVGVPGTNKALMRVYPEMFLSGPLIGDFLLSTDYGNLQETAVIATGSIAGAMWDVSMWDMAFWSSGAVFSSYNAPESRIDFNGTQADAFSFGIQTTGQSSPWIWAGLTGVMQQRGRT